MGIQKIIYQITETGKNLTQANIKTFIRRFTITLLAINLCLIGFSYAQDPPPPPGHGNSGNVPGGGAPIGSGLLVLIALGAAYGGEKVEDLKNNLLFYSNYWIQITGKARVFPDSIRAYLPSK